MLWRPLRPLNCLSVYVERRERQCFYFTSTTLSADDDKDGDNVFCVSYVYSAEDDEDDVVVVKIGSRRQDDDNVFI